MGQAADIVRKGRKFAQVVEGARQVFMADGFEGASVDDIAKAAGVSKATLYSYFPDKRLLFMEVATTECSRMADEALELVQLTSTPRDVLTIAASKLVPFLLSDISQSVFRMCVAESDRFPELGRSFYAAGPKMGHDRLSDYLTEAVQRGELNIDNIGMAADQFSELCKAKLWPRAVFGIQTRFEQKEIDEVVTNAVETFMARFGV